MKDRRLVMANSRRQRLSKLKVAVYLSDFGANTALGQVSDEAQPTPKVCEANRTRGYISNEFSHSHTDLMLNPFVLVKRFLQLKYYICTDIPADSGGRSCDK